MLFRDTVEVSAIPDPKVRGVTMFMSSVKDGRWKMKYMCAPLQPPAPSHALGPGEKPMRRAGVLSDAPRCVCSLNDPTSTSISVNQTGKVRFSEPIEIGPSGAHHQPRRSAALPLLQVRPLPSAPPGEECFMATKSIMFRSTKIRRIYDSSSNSLVYVSYRDALSSSEDESMDKNKYATSIAVVPLGMTRPPGA